MDAYELATRLAVGGRVQDLTGPNRRVGANHLYRIWTDGDGSRILKVYGTPARERRERHALDALSSIDGIPRIIDRGIVEGTVWATFADAGRWNLATLPENSGLAQKAGEILRTVHDSAPNPLSNLSRGIDQEWVTIDFASTMRRLLRYRGKLGVPLDLIEAASNVTPPFASEPRAAHTDPGPRNFLVDDDGNVTLINWEWATLAPPEWDLSKAIWLVGRSSGPQAAEALQRGYGKSMDPAQLDRWVVYHAAMNLVYEAEQQLSGVSKEPYQDLVAELQRAVAGATGPRV